MRRLPLILLLVGIVLVVRSQPIPVDQLPSVWCPMEYPSSFKLEVENGKKIMRNPSIPRARFEDWEIHVTFQNKDISDFAKDLGFESHYKPDYIIYYLEQMKTSQSELSRIRNLKEVYSDGFTEILVQSNYMPTDAPNPIKISAHTSVLGLDLMDYLESIYQPGMALDFTDREKLRSALRNDMTLYVDSRIFEHSVLHRIDLGDARNIQIVNSRTGGIYDNGWQVLNTQILLKELGYYHSKLDGINGNGTRSAVTSFRRDVGLNPSGLIDESLITEIERSSSRKGHLRGVNDKHTNAVIVYLEYSQDNLYRLFSEEGKIIYAGDDIELALNILYEYHRASEVNSVYFDMIGYSQTKIEAIKATLQFNKQKLLRDNIWYFFIDRNKMKNGTQSLAFDFGHRLQAQNEVVDETVEGLTWFRSQSSFIHRSNETTDVLTSTPNKSLIEELRTYFKELFGFSEIDKFNEDMTLVESICAFREELAKEDGDQFDVLIENQFGQLFVFLD